MQHVELNEVQKVVQIFGAVRVLMKLGNELYTFDQNTLGYGRASIAGATFLIQGYRIDLP